MVAQIRGQQQSETRLGDYGGFQLQADFEQLGLIRNKYMGRPKLKEQSFFYPSRDFTKRQAFEALGILLELWNAMDKAQKDMVCALATGNYSIQKLSSLQPDSRAGLLP